MGRKSTVRGLEPQIRAEVDRLLAEGRFTLDQILEHLRSLGATPPSRSALGRYAQNFEKVAARLRESREVTRALAQELGPESTAGLQGNILIESMRTLTYDILQLRLAAGEGKIDPKEIASLAYTVKELSRAARYDQDYELKIREAARRDAESKMEKALDAVAGGNEPLSPKEILEKVRAVYRGEA